MVLESSFYIARIGYWVSWLYTNYLIVKLRGECFHQTSEHGHEHHSPLFMWLTLELIMGYVLLSGKLCMRVVEGSKVARWCVGLI